jgi:WS/DGAT/MGAT family acyltransferase
MSKSIPPLDLMWLVMETPESPTHVGAMLVFQQPTGRPETVREIVKAYRRAKPTVPFSYVPEFGRGVPRFVEAEHVDPTYHVQHVAMPSGSSYEDFLRLLTDLHEPVLDRNRPLFRTWVIEGLPGHQFAIYSKVSHSIVDGASGAKRIYASLSTSPRDRIHPPPFATKAGPRKARPPKALVEKLAAMGTTATRQAAALMDISVGALRKSVARMTGPDPGGSQPFTARRAPMNEPLATARSLATLSLPLHEMREVGRHFHATLNDVVVTVVDEGVHRYLRHTGRAFPHRLVAMCPMSLREEGDTEAATKASAMFVHLGAPDATVADRIVDIVAAMGKAKEDLRAMSKEAAMLYAIAVLGLAELGKTTGVGRVAPPPANLVISNVPGAKETMYLNGARLLGTYAVPAIAASIGLNVTVSSYADSMDFGFGGNGATMYSLPELAGHVADAYEELKAAAGSKATNGGGRSKRSTRGRTARPRAKSAGSQHRRK